MSELRAFYGTLLEKTILDLAKSARIDSSAHIPAAHLFTILWDTFGQSIREDRISLRETQRLLRRATYDMVHKITGADCVFFRQMLTDGSARLIGKPHWYGGIRIGRPPGLMGPRDGISTLVLNKLVHEPVVIGDLSGEDVPPIYRDTRNRMRAKYAASQKQSVYRFLEHIKSEICVPLIIRDQIIGGIVAIKGSPISAQRCKEIAAALRECQAVLSFLHYTFTQLWRHETREGREEALLAAYPLIASSFTDDVFLMNSAIALTDPAIVGWQRALVFRFADDYPSEATCVMAMEGNGKHSRREEHGHLASLIGRIRSSAELYYSGYGNLFNYWDSHREGLVIPGHCFEDPDILGRYPWDSDAINSFAIESKHSVYNCATISQIEPVQDIQLEYTQYVYPLRRRMTNEAMGFVVLENPYAHGVDWQPDLALTRMACTLIAGAMEDRIIGRHDWVSILNELKECGAAARNDAISDILLKCAGAP